MVYSFLDRFPTVSETTIFSNGTVGANFSGIGGARLTGNLSTNVDFRGVDISGLDLSTHDLSEA